MKLRNILIAARNARKKTSRRRASRAVRSREALLWAGRRAGNPRRRDSFAKPSSTPREIPQSLGIHDLGFRRFSSVGAGLTPIFSDSNHVCGARSSQSRLPDPPARTGTSARISEPAPHGEFCRRAHHLVFAADPSAEAVDPAKQRPLRLKNRARLADRAVPPPLSPTQQRLRRLKRLPKALTRVRFFRPWRPELSRPAELAPCLQPDGRSMSGKLLLRIRSRRRQAGRCRRYAHAAGADDQRRGPARHVLDVLA